IACRHEADPWNENIEDRDAGPWLVSGRIEKLPERTDGALYRLRQDMRQQTEELLKQNDRQTDRSYGLCREAYQRREKHHAPAEHPDNSSEDELRVIKIECPGESNQR